jgi:nitric oxide reductase subunit B
MTDGPAQPTAAPATPAPDPVRRYASFIFLRGALLSLAIALVGGLISAIYSTPWGGAFLEPLGIDMRALRPLHTTFASAFLALAGLAIVQRYLADLPQPADNAERWGLRLTLSMWAVAGIGILVTLPLGITSGREYVGFHPILAIPIAVGWLPFCWNFLRLTWRGFWNRPLYVAMWGVGCVFFLYTFAEQYAWLLPDVFADPIVDRRIQWKACGSLVGALNLFVYGALIYTGEKLSGDKSYGRSRIAWALFGLGLLNSFTNFPHHTYHLPQSHLIKWLAFLISMSEIIILARAVWDVASMVRKPKAKEFCCASTLFASAKWWTLVMLVLAILLAVPPLNSLVHGTYFVAGHAMGSMIGIDTFILLGTCAAVLLNLFDDKDGAAPVLNCKTMGRIVIALNISVGAFVGWLHLVGIIDGFGRISTAADAPFRSHWPAWLTTLHPWVLASTGTITFLCFAWLLVRWARLVFRDLRPPGEAGVA